jgi:hypothetical protein
MENRIALLETSKKGKFPVIDLVRDDDSLRIGISPRITISMLRFMDKIFIDCDLGVDPGDFCRIGEIDLTKLDYQSMVTFDADFMARARSFENHFHVEKFVRERAKRLPLGEALDPFSVFGRERTDQIFSNLTDVFNEKTFKNLEFSIYRSDTMDDELMEEPMFTLCGSIKFNKPVAHYFLFADWTGNDLWSYGKHVFYNNTSFSDELWKPPKSVFKYEPIYF